MVQISSIVAFAIVPLLVVAAPAGAPAKAPASKAPAAPAPKGGAQGKSSSATSLQAAANNNGLKKGVAFKPAFGSGPAKCGKAAKNQKPCRGPDAKGTNNLKQAKGLPQGAHALAFDREKGQIHAFSKDMKHLGSVAAKGGKASAPGTQTPKGGAAAPGGKAGNDGKAPAPGAQTPKMVKQKRDGPTTGGCNSLSVDDLQKLPGWQTLKAAAEKNWGTGSYNVVTNDKDFPDSPATVCADTSTVMITTDPNPKCSNKDVKADGTLKNGSVAITQAFGTEYSNTMTVTKESSISTGVSVGFQVGIPDVESVSTTVTFDTTFTNSLAKSTTATSSTMSTITVTQNTDGTNQCLWLKTSNCDITGNGKARFLATGWVWFEYNDRTQGHYKWALSIDSTLPNQDDRSSFMEFKAAISGKTLAHYNDKC